MLYSISTSNALRQFAWERTLYMDVLKQSFFAQRLVGDALNGFVARGEEFKSSPDDILYVKTNLEANGPNGVKKGDRIYFGLVPRIDPATYPGVVSGQTLEGKEVAMSDYSFYVDLERYRQAVSAGTPIDWHRASFPVPETSRRALLTWGAEKIDKLCFDALDATTYAYVFYKTADTSPAYYLNTATAATAKSALTAAGSLLTPDFLSYVKAIAKTGDSRSWWPVRPVMVDGKPYFVYITHPKALFDIKRNSTMQQALREAETRGKENPIFNGATLIWDGIVVHENENCYIAADAGASSNVEWATGYFLGAQALCWAWGERPTIDEYTRDAKEELYHRWAMTSKVGKPYFHSFYYGSVLVYTSRSI